MNLGSLRLLKRGFMPAFLKRLIHDSTHLKWVCDAVADGSEQIRYGLFDIHGYSPLSYDKKSALKTMALFLHEESLFVAALRKRNSLCPAVMP